MKILKVGGILVLAAATVFFGFHFFFGKHAENLPSEEQTEQEKQYLEEAAFYRDLAASLEESLCAMREEHYIAQTQYEAKIEELELCLKNAESQADTQAQPSIPYTYTVLEEGVIITGYVGQADKISLPAQIDGLPVVGIGRDAFRQCALKEIVIPNTVKRIDWFAFYQSPLLERVAIPSGVTMIEYGAFDGCDRLTVFCEKNSYADRYARSFGMKVVN